MRKMREDFRDSHTLEGALGRAFSEECYFDLLLWFGG